MAIKIISVLDELTNLTTDVDLFYLEMPLDKSGLWVQDSMADYRFNGVDATEYDIYYRGKNKTSAVSNIGYLKAAIDALHGSTSVCKYYDGKTIRLDMLRQWEFVGKDSEGFYVFANKVRLYN